MTPQTAIPGDPRTEAYYSVWAADPSREIVVGAKYRQNPLTCYCWTGCETCVPLSGQRCWQRRTALSFVYRVREHLHTDYVHGTGRRYLVTLVKPDVWQMRAFMAGGSRDWEKRPQTWHEQTGIVCEAQLGEKVNE